MEIEQSEQSEWKSMQKHFFMHSRNGKVSFRSLTIPAQCIGAMHFDVADVKLQNRLKALLIIKCKMIRNFADAIWRRRRKCNASNGWYITVVSKISSFFFVFYVNFCAHEYEYTWTIKNNRTFDHDWFFFSDNLANWSEF